jgi:hypothetical protein
VRQEPIQHDQGHLGVVVVFAAAGEVTGQGGLEVARQVVARLVVLVVDAHAVLAFRVVGVFLVGWVGQSS